MRRVASRASGIVIIFLALLLFVQHTAPRSHASSTAADSASWSQIAQLTASDAAESDWLGFAVAIDGGVAVVGAPNADIYGPDSGVVYVFEKGAGGWQDMQQTAELFPSDGAAYDGFGTAVGISGSTIVVGAPRAHAGAPSSGALYVYQRPVSGWHSSPETARLTIRSPQEGDNLGAAVAIEEHIIAAGAPGLGAVADGGPGAIYVYARPSGGWRTAQETARLYAADGTPWDGLGFAVSLSNGTLAAGAPFADHAGANSGAAYLFVQPPNGWISGTETAKLTPAAAAAYDWFGRSLALMPQGLLVGAPQDDRQARNAGAAYYFAHPAAGWQDGHETALLVASDARADDRFGWSTAAAADSLAVGAAFPPERAEAGRVYLYDVPQPTGQPVAEREVLHALHAAPRDRFGIALAGSGEHLLIGADSVDTLVQDAGAAYIFARTGIIAIENETDPPGGQGFTFSHTLPGSNPFALDGGQTQLFAAVPPGRYTVTQTDPRPGYDLIAVVCLDSDTGGGTSSGSVADRTASIALEPGETVTCRFSNTQRGQIVVALSAEPLDTAQPFSFQLTGGPDAVAEHFTLLPGDEPAYSDLLKPGTYTLATTQPQGWRLASAVCTGGSPPDHISLAPGATAVCHVTFQQFGHIRVAKETIPPQHHQQFNFTLRPTDGSPAYAFALSARDEPFESGQLPPGRYALSEQPSTEWELSTALCSDGGTPDLINLQPGQTITCTFRNRLLHFTTYLPLFAR